MYIVSYNSYNYVQNSLYVCFFYYYYYMLFYKCIYCTPKRDFNKLYVYTRHRLP